MTGKKYRGEKNAAILADENNIIHKPIAAIASHIFFPQLFNNIMLHANTVFCVIPNALLTKTVEFFAQDRPDLHTVQAKILKTKLFCECEGPILHQRNFCLAKIFFLFCSIFSILALPGDSSLFNNAVCFLFDVAESELNLLSVGFSTAFKLYFCYLQIIINDYVSIIRVWCVIYCIWGWTRH